jgi:hypothetical protein
MAWLSQLSGRRLENGFGDGSGSVSANENSYGAASLAGVSWLGRMYRRKACEMARKAKTGVKARQRWHQRRWRQAAAHGMA